MTITNRTFSCSILFALAGLMASCGDDTMTFSATLTAAAETPASTSTANGSATFTLSDDGTTLTYSVTHNVANPTAAHIHEGAPGMAGAVVVALDPINAGTVTLTADQATKLEAGSYYVNIHDAQNMMGAIRGQIELE